MMKMLKLYIFFAFLFYIQPFSQNKTVIKLNTKEKNLAFGLTTPVPEELPKIGLALSGGGSRGLSQVGVLKALLEHDIPFDVVVGTSMGSIVGGLYSIGYSIEELDSISASANWNDFLSAKETNRNELFIDQKITEDKAVFTLRLDGFKPIIPTSISTGQKISNFFSLLTLNAPIHVNNSFNDLRKSFYAVSTDLVSGEPVVIDNGSLSMALRASSSVSFLLAPVKTDSSLLVDGGLVANIPAKVTKELGCDFVIAVDATSPLHQRKDLDLPWIVADQIVSIPMRKINEAQLAYADIIIKSCMITADLNEFNNIPNIIEKGYKNTNSQIDSIETTVESYIKNSLEKEPREITNLILSSSPSDLEKHLYSKLSKTENISTRDIKYELYKVLGIGDYKTVTAELISDSVSTTLFVNEELFPIVKQVEIKNNDIYIKSIAHLCLDKMINEPYNTLHLQEALISCLRKFRADGYSLIDIEEINFNTENNVLSVDFTDGIIDNMYVDGNKITEDELILREIPIERGTLLKHDQIRQSLINLRSTNLFDEIEINIEKDGRRNKLEIKVSERPSQLLRFGFTIDNENQTQVTLDLRDENLIGTGTELGAILLLGTRNRSVILEHKANRIFDTYLTYKLRAFHGFTDYYTYDDEPSTSESKFERTRSGEYRHVYTGASFSLGTQVQKLGNLIAEIKYQKDIIKNKIDYPYPRQELDLFSLKLSLNIDTQNKYPYPTSGLKVNSYYETGQTLLAGDVGYSKFFINYQGFIALAEPSTISPRFTLGFADETLPLSQQFSFGGQHSFFGFKENDYRGRQIFITSVEYRYKLPVKLFFDTYVKTRYDLGSIWSQPEDIKFKEFKHGIGFALSFDTPIGPADFAIGKAFIIKNILSDNILSWGDAFLYFNIGYYY